MATTGKNNKRNTSSGRSGSRKSASKSTTRARSKTTSVPLIDERAASDIFGIVLLALGLALGVAVLSANTGIVAEYIARGLALIVGIGRYIVPLALVISGATFFIPSLRLVETRVAVGLGLIVVAIIGLVGLGTPHMAAFTQAALEPHGGYVGNALAWVLVQLAGVTIAAILLAALAIVGLIITGLSLSRMFEKLGETRAIRKEERSHQAAQEALQTPRTKRISAGDAGVRKDPAADSFSNQKTTRLDDDALSDADKTAILEKNRSERLKQTHGTDDHALAQNTTAPPAQEDFELPPFNLLKVSKPQTDSAGKDAKVIHESIAATIVDTLHIFDVPAQVVDWIAGPTVTLFKVEIAKGIRLNKVTTLADDLALALAAPTLRILAPIPGESLVGIEVPNVRRSSVTLGDILVPAGSGGGPLLLGIGKDITGAGVLRDLAGMPHLLIGGSTGSGKSVAINAMIMSIIMRATPSQVRLILIDPKRVELSMFNGLPHLYVPVVTTPKDAASALAWAVNEMDRRLKVLEKAKVKNIGEYNQQLLSGKADDGALEMPYLVVVIDELADLMMVAAKDVESSIVRIAQLARAAGIHLIVATQRPDANVVTPLIKANITNRVAFRTATSIDSRVVLDQSGAEQLTGLGDMLFSIPAWPHPKRIQGCFVSEEEINAVVANLKEQSEPDYHQEIFATPTIGSGGSFEGEEEDDPLVWEAAEMVVSAGFGSTSGVQRRFKVGYARAGRIMDMLQSKGVVGPPDGSKPREVLVDSAGLTLLQRAESDDGDGKLDEYDSAGNAYHHNDNDDSTYQASDVLDEEREY